jgi:hypothetical protein
MKEEATADDPSMDLCKARRWKDHEGTSDIDQTD